MSDQTISPTEFARALAGELYLNSSPHTLVAWRVGSDVYATPCAGLPHTSIDVLNAVMRELELPPSFSTISTSQATWNWYYAGQQRGLHEVIDVYEPYKASLEYRKYDPARKEIP